MAEPWVKQRTATQKLLDCFTFPIRAVTLFEYDRFGLSSLATERFDFVGREVRGECLDMGCGRNNRFVREVLSGRGRGIDGYPYEGLGEEELVEDFCSLPFHDEAFDTVTFIASFNHTPEHQRDAELVEAHRLLRPGGRIVISMGAPVAEVLVHKLVALYDRVLGTDVDMDGERGMGEGEDYYVADAEIFGRLGKAGFEGTRKSRFWTQWGFNSLFLAEKPCR